MSFCDFRDNPIYLSGTSKFLPKRKITNEQLIEMMGVKLKPKWIEKRTGIQTRYWADEEACSDLAYGAAIELFNSNPDLKEKVGLVALATISGDYSSPPTAPFLQSRLEFSTNVGCYDLGAACSGFVTGLINSSSMCKTIKSDVLLISSEIRSKYLSLSDFQTAVLFGDGATACVITEEKARGKFQLLAGELLSDGSVADIISIPVGGSKQPVSKDNIDQTHLTMRSGADLFIKATNGMYESTINLLQNLKLEVTDIDYIVPHQANLHMIHLLAQRLEVPLEKVSQTVVKWGNTSGATVGMALNDLAVTTELSSGSKILLISAGGGGLTANAVLEVL